MSGEWRGEYARRFNQRVTLDRPPRPKPYVRLTDEQIAAFPEQARPGLLLGRAFRDAVDSFGASWLRRLP